MGGRQVLVTATVVMGVMLLLGTTALIVMLARRGAVPVPAPTPVPMAAVPPSFARTLHEPVGTTIVGIAAAGNRLAVALHGGGPDRVVLIDPRTGGLAGQVSVSP